MDLPELGAGSCTNPSVPPGSTGTITAIYKVTREHLRGRSLPTLSPQPRLHTIRIVANNSATVNIAVASGAQADLSVTNSAARIR